MRKLVIGLIVLMALFTFISAYSGVPRAARERNDPSRTQSALVEGLSIE